MKDYYAVLEIEVTASAEEITSAFKKQMKKFHPDVNKSEDALEKTKEINEAYKVLHDQKQKEIYDYQRSPFNRIPAGFPQGVRIFYTQNPQPARINIVVVHTPNGQQVWVNGMRVQ